MWPVPGAKELTSAPVSLRSTKLRPGPELRRVGATTRISLPVFEVRLATARPSVACSCGSVKTQAVVSAGAVASVATAFEVTEKERFVPPTRVV